MSLDKATIERMTEKYRELIFRFANQQIPVEEFEPDYLRLFKYDKDQVPSPEFDILEKLFFAVDDYVADPGLRQAVRGLDEDQLRDCARATYQRLYLGTDR
jgi:hypothetical protein